MIFMIDPRKGQALCCKGLTLGETVRRIDDETWGVGRTQLESEADQSQSDYVIGVRLGIGRHEEPLSRHNSASEDLLDCF